MASLRTKKRNNSESGIALAIAILVLLVLSTVVAGLMIMSTTETRISANFRDESRAFFAARGGLEEARDRLRAGSPNSLNANLPAALPGTAATSVLYITNPLNGENVMATYPDNEICKEFGGTCPGGNWSTTAAAGGTYAASPKLDWKWVRIMVKTNRSDTGSARITSVDGLTNGNRICWNGSNEVVTANPTCGGNAAVYQITALAVTPSGSRRMLQYEETINVMVPVVAALYAQNAINTGQALNVTGATDSVCASPSTYGAASGTSTVTTPGGGNVTGTPGGTINNYGWSVNMTNMINSLSSGATDILTVPGATPDAGVPPNISVPQGSLGTAPTVTYSGSDNISAITNPGTPVTYITPDLWIPGTNPPQYRTLTVGGSGTGISGQGVLIVRGNLTIDFGKNWDYFGLIIVQGNLSMINTGNGNANPHIHGAVVVGGTLMANGVGMGNFNGSISIHQNACMVQNAIGAQFYKTVAQRELIY